jgi:peptidoglycan/LPS O-acetylase OafA/YrhL
MAFIIWGAPDTFRRSWPYLYTYTLNYQNTLSPGPPVGVFFSHLWSLAVEEQFYLIWPALVYLVPRRKFPLLIVALLAACPLLRGAMVHLLRVRGYGPGFIGESIYLSTFCQLDSFATGAFVVLFRDRLSRHSLRNFLACSFLLIAAGQVSSIISTGAPAIDTSFGYPRNSIINGQHIWSYTLINVWTASLLIVACQVNGISKQLSRAPIVYLGRISYGVYVLQPSIQWLTRTLAGNRHGIESGVLFAIYFASLLVVCSAVYRWYEVPFLRLKDRALTAPPVIQPVAAS